MAEAKSATDSNIQKTDVRRLTQRLAQRLTQRLTPTLWPRRGSGTRAFLAGVVLLTWLQPACSLASSAVFSATRSSRSMRFAGLAQVRGRASGRRPASAARPDEEMMKKAQALAVAGKVEDAVKILNDALSAETDTDKRAIVRMALAVIEFNAGRDKESESQFKKALEEKTRIDDYANYDLGLIYRKAGRLSEARDAFQLAAESGAPSQTQIEARLRLAETYMAEKNYKAAVNQYGRLVKKTRATEGFPEILLNLYRAEKKLAHRPLVCKWARELYAKYPSYSVLHDWGADLARDAIDGEKTGCVATQADFKTRIRRMQLAGEGDRAAKELMSLKDAVDGDNVYNIDSMLASYLVSEGRVEEAMKLILKHYKKESSRPAYQLLLAKASSRAGEYEAAVGAFMKAYELAPHAKDAANALFQAAFTSYQFQDYDGATRKFERFMKAFPKSKLARDSQWHLAWIRYLRADYAGALDSFTKIAAAPVSRRRRGRRMIVRSDSVAQDRVRYWTAMSLVKLGRSTEAIPILQKLVRDPALGYYSMLAYYRLGSVPGAKIPAIVEIRLGLKKADAAQPLTAEELQLADESAKSSQSRLNEDFNASAIVGSAHPSTDGAGADAGGAVINDVANESASDASSDATSVADDADDTADSDVAANDDADDANSLADAAEGALAEHQAFNAPGLGKRFERARDFMTVGLEEAARRELMEIERRAHSIADRKLLITEYLAVRNFYRASYMGEVGFGVQRMREGLRGESRPFWEYAYPRAYEPAVLEASKSTTVPEELIWGIMRAESHFKQNAQSPVGALGLMQLMPFTGRKIASLLSINSFEPTSLLIPETNIRLGSRYLQRLLEKFSGSVPLVAAGYNAGPHRVHAWVRNFGQLDMDEFIEHIPFIETRNYVKNVVRNYQIYGLLYSGGTHSLRWLIKPGGVELSDPAPTKEIW